MNDSLAAWVRPRLAALEAELATCFAETWPPRLREACRYPLQTGGKRIRPMLCFAAAEAAEGSWVDATRAGVALELLHTYSLVHDDLPAMDDDEERRGRPTVHVVYGEGPAVLVGDALLTEAFTVLAAEPGARAVRLVAELAAAGGGRGMIAGQAVDVGMDGPVVDLDGLVRLHRAKTGALIRAAVRMGGLCAAADDATLAALTRYGEAVGLAFQVADDLLDADEDAALGGPPSFVKLLGREGTRAAAEAYVADALEAVAGLPHAGALVDLARFAVERDR